MRKHLVPLGLATLSAVALFSAAVFSRAAAKSGTSGYHVIKTVSVPGDEGWDYVYVDSDARRVYISHGSHVVVMNADTYAIEGDIPDTPGVHGITVAADLGRGFTSNGRANTITIFDLKTLKTIGTAKTDANPDAIIYDPATKRVFTFNGRGKNSTVINAADGSVVGTVPLGDKPEFGLVAERNSADHGAIGGIDDGGVFAAAVKGEDALGGRVVNDGVGIRVGLCGADGLQSFEIENGDRVCAAIAGEAAAEVCGYGHAVDSGRVRNVAFDGVGIGIHDHDVGAVRDVDAAGVAVDVNVVPSFVAGNGNSFDDVIAGGAGLGSGAGKYSGGKKSDGGKCSEA